MYSLEDNIVEDREKPVACRELLAMLADEELAQGDARKRGMGRLRALTGQDFGEDWKAWKAWIEEHLPA